MENYTIDLKYDSPSCELEDDWFICSFTLILLLILLQKL